MKVLFMGLLGGRGADYGYGNAACGIASVLVRMRQQGRIDLLEIFDFSAPTAIRNSPFDVTIIMASPVTIAHSLKESGSFVSLLMKSKRAYLSVVWEASPLPQAWAPLWESSALTGFLGPSGFICEMLSQATRKPVHYFPHFVDVNEIPLNAASWDGGFTVLFVGQNTERKGIREAVIAFARALGDKEDARLILKYHQMSDKEMPVDSLVRSLVACNVISPAARIYSNSDSLEREELLSLYKSASAFLFPSRGEGFGLPPAEAMSAGLPVIYTDWSSLSEVCASPVNCPVEYTLDEAHSMAHFFYESGSRWAVPKISSLINGLSILYSSWKRDPLLYFDSGLNNRRLIDKRYGYEAVSACIEKILEAKE